MKRTQVMVLDGSEIAGDLPRAYLAPCLLLLLAEGSTHGYELHDQLSAIGFERADSGSMYRALRSMERGRLVHSSWEPSRSGPARRRYELTDEGHNALHAWAATIGELHRLLGDYLERYRRVESACPS